MAYHKRYKYNFHLLRGFAKNRTDLLQHEWTHKYSTAKNLKYVKDQNNIVKHVFALSDNG